MNTPSHPLHDIQIVVTGATVYTIKFHFVIYPFTHTLTHTVQLFPQTILLLCSYQQVQGYISLSHPPALALQLPLPFSLW